ncbi:RNA polymerase sigma factor [Aquimarina sediminis]|uniref:RNA polymerase sigma factor n=1 Tax=Aquimarina sediminis TaxID=2070536 RepID=UPI000CA08523|nr:RNA polymerase sigma-70 factor [Aquimarina sediminis]
MAKPNKNIVNKALVKALKKGKVDAFETIFRLYERRLYHFVFAYTKSKYISEEIIQYIFIKIWEDREQIDPKKSFHSYLFVLAKNRTFNYLRDAKNRESIKTELWNSRSKSYEQIDSDINYSDYGAIVKDIVQSFPKTEQSVYRLSIEEGKSHIEIASILGITVKTVRNHLWKIKSSIRSQLLPYLYNITIFLYYYSYPFIK